MKTKLFIAASQNNPMLTQLTPIPQGLTKIGCSESSIAAEVRSTITQIAVRCADKLGLRMPKVEGVVSLHSGNSRKVEQAKLLHGAKLHSACGEVYGIKPTKIGNQLQWPVEPTAKLLTEGE